MSPLRNYTVAPPLSLQRTLIGLVLLWPAEKVKENGAFPGANSERIQSRNRSQVAGRIKAALCKPAVSVLPDKKIRPEAAACSLPASGVKKINYLQAVYPPQEASKSSGPLTSAVNRRQVIMSTACTRAHVHAESRARWMKTGVFKEEQAPTLNGLDWV